MTPNQARQFANFADLIKRRITLIRMNDHHPILSDVEDQRDLELEDAYEALRPLLICISEPRLYEGVASLPENQGPFIAENAHHALSIQFNPPESMFGNPSLLESNAIKHMLDHASAERSRLAAMPTIPVAVPVPPLCSSDIWEPEFVQRWKLPEMANPLRPITSIQEKSRWNRRTAADEGSSVRRSRKPRHSPPNRSKRGLNGEWSEDMVILHTLLMAHHRLAFDDRITDELGNQKEIAEILHAMYAKEGKPWAPSRVSRTMQQLFVGSRGYNGHQVMKWYRNLCDSGRIIDELKWIDLRSLKRRLEVHDLEKIVDYLEDRGRSTDTDVA